MKVLISTNTTQRVNEVLLGQIKLFLSRQHKVIILAQKNHDLDIDVNAEVRFINLKTYPDSYNFLSNIILVFKYIYYYNKLNPDLIIHSTIKSNIFGGLAARILNKKYYSTISGLGNTYFNKQFFNTILKFLYVCSQKKASKVLFQNIWDKNVFINKGFIDSKKCSIVPAGKDLKIFNKKKYIRKNKKFNFLYIGRLVQEKGIYTFLDAATELSKKYTDMHFYVIGEISRSNDNIKNRYSSRQINFLGYKKNIQQFLVNTDCLVLPSFREGMSNVLMEAGCFGKPSITSNVPGCKDIISHNYNGLLCEKKNTTSLKKQMEKYFKLEKIQKIEMGNNAFLNIQKNFNIKLVDDYYIKLLEI